MRTEFPVNFTTKAVNNIDILRRKHAILQSNVDRVGQRCANTCKNLPREASVGIVKAIREGSVDRCINVGAGNTNTGTEEALKAIIRAEVCKTVDHEAQCVAATSGSTNTGRSDAGSATTREARSADSNRVDISFTVAGFSFEASAAEVVTYDTAEVVTFSVIHRKVISLTVNVEIEVFHEHYAAVEFDVPRIFAGMGRRCKHRRRHRHTYDEFPHYKIPL